MEDNGNCRILMALHKNGNPFLEVAVKGLMGVWILSSPGALIYGNSGLIDHYVITLLTHTMYTLHPRAQGARM